MDKSTKNRLQSMDASLPKELRDDLRQTFDHTSDDYKLPSFVNNLVECILEMFHMDNVQKTAFKEKEQLYMIIAYCVGVLETFFLFICMLLNVIHFATYVPKYHESPGYEPEADSSTWVLVITMLEIVVACGFETAFLIALIQPHRVHLMKYHPMFQLVMAAVLLLNATFSFCVDFGGENDLHFYAKYNPAIIRFLTFFSFFYMIVDLLLFFITRPIVKYLRDFALYRHELLKKVWKHNTHMFYNIVHIMYLSFHADAEKKRPISIVSETSEKRKNGLRVHAKHRSKRRSSEKTTYRPQETQTSPQVKFTDSATSPVTVFPAKKQSTMILIDNDIAPVIHTPDYPTSSEDKATRSSTSSVEEETDVCTEARSSTNSDLSKSSSDKTAQDLIKKIRRDQEKLARIQNRIH